MISPDNEKVFMADKELSEADIEKINKIISTLQEDINKVKNHAEKMQFNDALKGIITAMGHTDCPLCKEKLSVLSSKIIEAKMSCDKNNPNCNLILKEAIDKADSIKNDFIPIATEKRFIKNKEQTSKSFFEAVFDPLGIFKNRK